jgi:hypothetical protein
MRNHIIVPALAALALFAGASAFAAPAGNARAVIEHPATRFVLLSEASGQTRRLPVHIILVNGSNGR